MKRKRERPSAEALESVVVEHRKRLGHLRSTHDILCGLAGKRLELRAGQPRTDCASYISVPFESPHADVLLKHEHGHNLFGTQLAMRHRFACDWATAFNNRIVQDEGAGLPEYQRQGLIEFIHLLCNVLDDLRVNSLWARLYPYSAERIAERWRAQLLQSQAYRTDMSMMLMALGLGLKPLPNCENSIWWKHRGYLEGAAQRVAGQPYETVLAVAHDVLEHFLVRRRSRKKEDGTHQHSAKASSEDLTDALRAMQNMMGHKKRPESDMLTYEFEGSGFGAEKLTLEQQSYVYSLLAQRQGYQFASLVSHTQRVARTALERLMQRLQHAGRRLSGEDALLKGLTDTRLVEVKSPPTRLAGSDAQLAAQLRSIFDTVRGKTGLLPSDTGVRLNAGAYVDALTGSDVAVFEEEQIDRGFSAVVLTDMSGSMYQDFSWVARAAAILAHALESPYVDFEVLGFSSLMDYRYVYRLHNPAGFVPMIGQHVGMWGGTPLPVALEVALRRLSQMPGHSRHLFVLSDGVPSDTRTSGAVLREQVAAEMRAARARGISVTTLVVGEQVSDTEALSMFGPRRFWRRVPYGEGLLKELVALCRASFTAYIRGQ